METTFPIEPARIEDVPSAIADLVADLAAVTAKLESALPAQTARSLSAMVRIMNTYYSNLIEGNVTRPRDIEAASRANVITQSDLPQTVHIEAQLLGGVSANQHRTDLLIEALAHIHVQSKIDQMAAISDLPDPASEEFVRWLHSEFYLGATPAMLKISGAQTSYQMTPGVWRSTHEQDVAVGRHLPPSSERVAEFMTYFAERYKFVGQGKATRILSIAAAHHRFNYIHPFPDGNGRVSRLMSHAMAHHAGIGAHGLWSISRGLARGIGSRNEYKSMMAYADSPRQGDLDGRGNLSQKALLEFTKWFLQVCLDQVQFMASLFQIDTLSDRLQKCVNAIGIEARAGALLDEALVRGQFERGDAARITGLPERSARRLLSEVIAAGLLASDTPKAAVSLRFPMEYQDVLFPRLFTET